MLETIRCLLSTNLNWKCSQLYFANKKNTVRYFTAIEERFFFDAQKVAVFWLPNLLATDFETFYPIIKTWQILYKDDEELQNKSKLEEWTKNKGIQCSFIKFKTFRNKVLNIEYLKKEFTKRHKNWYETEGEDFVYISPRVVSDRYKNNEDLHSFANDFINLKNVGKGIFFLFGEYGEGKTSFCREFVYSQSWKLQELERIPLIFYLSDYESGSLSDFIMVRLKKDYGLSIDFEEFVKLCQDGCFTLFLDAFDQMLSVPVMTQLKQDFRQIKRMVEGRGQVFLTCRYSYYKKYLVNLMEREEVGNTYQLRGFDEDKLQEYAKKRPALRRLLRVERYKQLISSIGGKPILLKLISDNEKETEEKFKELLAKGRNRLSQYDAFDISYRKWENSQFNMLITLKMRNTLMRSIARMLMEHGLNRIFSFNDWLKQYEQETGHKIEDKIQLKAELSMLMFFDTVKLTKDDRLTFAAGPYLEYMVSKFVLEELASSPTKYEISFVKEILLDIEIRNMIVSQLYHSVYSSKISRLIEATSSRNFDEVLYQGTNCFTLMLDGVRSEERQLWLESIKNVNFKRTVLRYSDCRNADLSRLIFSEVDFTGSDFSFAKLTNTNMEFSNLTHTKFDEQGDILTASFVYTGDSIAGGTKNGSLIMWDYNKKEVKDTIRLHYDEITSLAVSEDGMHIYTGSRDGNIYVSDIADKNNEVRGIPLKIKGICSLVLSFDEYIIAGGQTGDIGIFHVLNPADTRYIKLAPNTWLTALALSPDGKTLIAGHSDGKIQKIMNWQAKQENSEQLCDLEYEVTGICIGDSDYAVVSTTDNIFILNLKDNSIKELGIQGVKKIVMAKNSKMIFMLEYNKNIRFGSFEDIKIGNKKTLNSVSLDLEANTISISLDGSLIAVGGEQLQVFKKDNRGIYTKRGKMYMRLDCSYICINYCKGIDTQRLEFFLHRGALLPTDITLKDYFDIEIAQINRLDNTFKCFECKERNSFLSGFKIIERRLYCKNCKQYIGGI